MTKLRLFPSLLLLLLPLLLREEFPAAQAQAATQSAIVLHAAGLLDVKSGRLVKPGEVLVMGERIAEAGTSVKHPPGAQVIDLGQRILMPGLIDAHVHLF